MEMPPSDPRAQQASPVIPLSAGVPTANKVLVLVLTALIVLVVLPLLALVSGALSYSTGGLALAGPIFGGIFGGGLVLVLIWALFRIFRGGAQVQGTELTVRGAFRNQRVDLATARLLRLTDANSGWSATPNIPTIEAHGDARGRSATVHFRCARAGFIPLPEVEALAAAIRAGSGWRDGLATDQAERAVQELYLRAYAPHPGIG